MSDDRINWPQTWTGFDTMTLVQYMLQDVLGATVRGFKNIKTCSVQFPVVFALQLVRQAFNPDLWIQNDISNINTVSCIHDSANYNPT